MSHDSPAGETHVELDAEFAAALHPRIVRRTAFGVELVFPYDKELIALVKQLRGIRYDGGRRVWWAPFSAPYLREIAVFARAHGFMVEEAVKVEAKTLIAERRVNLATSRAADADFTVDGLGGVLLPYQRAGAGYAVRNCAGMLLGDEMGLGKTPQALATLLALRAFPAVIVCPATILWQWAAEAEKWIPGISVAVIEGSDKKILSGGVESESQRAIATGTVAKTRGNGVGESAHSQSLPSCASRSSARPAQILILSYDVLAAHLRRAKKKAGGPADPADGWVRDLRALDPQAVVFDEIHYLKCAKTKRHAAARALADGLPVRLGLSGSPVENTPVDLLSILQVLGRLDDFGGYTAFADRYCARKQVPVPGRSKKIAWVENRGTGWQVVTAAETHPFPNRERAQEHANKLNGWRWDLNGALNLPELQGKLRATCLVRRLKRDVLPELPDKRRVLVTLPLTNSREYQAARADVLAWVATKATQDPAFRDAIVDKSPEEKLRAIWQRAQAAAARAEKCEELTRMGVLRQLAAAGKLPALAEWVENFLATGETLLLFGLHRAIVEGIATRFGVPALTGDTPPRDRQRMVADFAARKRPLFVANLIAGGTGLDGLQHVCTNVGFMEQGWNPARMDQAEDRLHRIGQKNAVTAWHFLARGTVDWLMRDLIETKRETVREAVGDR